MNPRDQASGGRQSAALFLCVTIALGLLTCGCAQSRYDALALGQRPAEYEGVLPADTSRRTSLGLCQFESRGDAVSVTVALVSEDRRIAAKLRAETGRSANMLGTRRAGYVLTAEVDPQLFRTQATSPFDVLRLIALDLAEYRGEKLATDAHAWIAIGVVRMLQRFPHVEPLHLDSPRVDELSDRVPAGGRAELSVGADGVLRFQYSAP